MIIVHYATFLLTTRYCWDYNKVPANLNRMLPGCTGVFDNENHLTKCLSENRMWLRLLEIILWKLLVLIRLITSVARILVFRVAENLTSSNDLRTGQVNSEQVWECCLCRMKNTQPKMRISNFSHFRVTIYISLQKCVFLLLLSKSNFLLFFSKFEVRNPESQKASKLGGFREISFIAKAESLLTAVW